MFTFCKKSINIKTKGYIVVLVLLAFIVLLAQCEFGDTKEQATVTNTPQLTYLNWHDTVNYVGIETCKLCHANTHSTFIETGMGKSFGKADTAKSAAIFNGKQIYDKDLDLYYLPFWENDTSLFLTEYRLKGQDTTHKLTTYIHYVVGSGQHTNSHIVNNNGYHYQAPFTWYAQKGKLDFPPGYEGGKNLRFERPIGLECMSCHNAMPTQFVLGSYNKFSALANGIDCERCHGPGELHVKRVSAGLLVDTATEIDYSIVNPKKLNAQLQFEICQRCHLQGNTVLAPNKSFFSFKPGMQLNEVMDVYLPRYENGEDQFIMASHADRFKLSQCFKQSNEAFNCISCHNPHISVKATNIQKFNSTCVGCHSNTTQQTCTHNQEALKQANHNCVSCHMPSSGATDIPHVTVHDHFIRKPVQTKASKLGKFLGLKAINNSKPTTYSKIVAYLQQYERFGGDQQMLDSAEVLLSKYQGEQKLSLQIHYYSLKQDFRSITALAENKTLKEIKAKYNQQSYENVDAWMHYRIGEAYVRLGQYNNALSFLKNADSLAPFVLNFKTKLGDCYLNLGNLNKAKETYLTVLQEQPNQKTSLNNLGFVYLRLGDLKLAANYLVLCSTQYPNYEQVWLNLAQLGIIQQNTSLVEKALAEVLSINPNNMLAKQTLNKIRGA